ncbi:MAG TPA: GxxExxY protein [Candidatus Angelobacter sp.]
MDNEGTGKGTKLIYEELTEKIIGAAIEVHRVLGPGLLESVYRRALCHELKLRNLSFRQQIEVPLHYKGVDLECGFRIDLIVEDTVILELKSVANILPVHEAQLLTYMRLMKKPVGFIINFNVPVLKYGIVRRVL